MRPSTVPLVVVLMLLLLLMFSAAVPQPSAAVHGVGGGGGLLHIPSAASLAHCPSSCGNISVSYPFGIGPGCFRQGFELTCDDTAHPPRLYLGNSTTQQVTYSSTNRPYVSVPAIGFNITMSPGVNTYNRTWEAPAQGVFAEYNDLYVVGCDVDLYMFGYNTNDIIGACTSTCLADRGAMEKSRYCRGDNGCCYIEVPREMESFWFKLVRHDGAVAAPHPNFKVLISYHYDYYTTDLYSSWVNSSNLEDVQLYIPITDQPGCQSAQRNKNSYACSDESSCIDSNGQGYYCSCHGVTGNPYVRDGCIGSYNQKTKENCKRSCGNMIVPFPFGFEDDCFANSNFRLNCTLNNTIVMDRGYAQYRVTNVSLNDGSITVSNMLNNTSSNNAQVTVYSAQYKDGDVRIMIHENAMDDLLDFSEEDEIIIKWVVANLTCQKATRSATYACLSTNSSCLPVERGKIHLGYRCKCDKGFQGNPYLEGGCTDINECLLPNYCNGVCKNFKGGYNCVGCPHGKVFDHTKRKCVMSANQHNLLLYTTVGISCGLGSIVSALGATILANKWKKGIQKRIRRAYFMKNQGLLLEQLISEERVTNKTKIFSLEELDEATNNFDATRVLGRGGHGTVYKGILSDQVWWLLKSPKLWSKLK